MNLQKYYIKLPIQYGLTIAPIKSYHIECQTNITCNDCKISVDNLKNIVEKYKDIIDKSFDNSMSNDFTYSNFEIIKIGIIPHLFIYLNGPSIYTLQNEKEILVKIKKILEYPQLNYIPLKNHTNNKTNVYHISFDTKKLRIIKQQN